MPKLHSLPILIAHADTRTTRLPPKVKEPVYNSREFQLWRAAILARAGYRCEAVDDDRRCGKAAPHHRLYADHIAELKDGGSLTDLSNGQCLCRSHHELKTIAARKKRFEPSAFF